MPPAMPPMDQWEIDDYMAYSSTGMGELPPDMNSWSVEEVMEYTSRWQAKRPLVIQFR